MDDSKVERASSRRLLVSCMARSTSTIPLVQLHQLGKGAVDAVQPLSYAVIDGAVYGSQDGGTIMVPLAHIRGDVGSSIHATPCSSSIETRFTVLFTHA